MRFSYNSRTNNLIIGTLNFAALAVLAATIYGFTKLYEHAKVKEESIKAQEAYQTLNRLADTDNNGVVHFREEDLMFKRLDNHRTDDSSAPWSDLQSRSNSWDAGVRQRINRTIENYYADQNK